MFGRKFKQQKLLKRIGKKLSALPSNSLANNKEIHSVGILASDNFSNLFDIQEKVREKLNLRNAKIYSYRTFDADLEKSYKHFCEEDFNSKGEIVETSFKSFIDEPFDLLICYYKDKQQLLEYATSLSKATFKVGFADVNAKLFHLEINSSPLDEDLFFEEVHRYLTILNKLQA